MKDKCLCFHPQTNNNEPTNKAQVAFREINDAYSFNRIKIENW